MKCNSSLWFCLLSLAVSLPCGGEVLFNEIMYHPPPAVPEDPELEWCELHNRGAAAVPLGGWRIGGGIEFRFTEITTGTNLVLPPGGYLVVAANRAAFCSQFPMVANVAGDWSGQLANNGQTLRLLDAQGVEVDRVSYASEGDWARRVRGPYDIGHYGWRWEAGPDGGGSSLELVNPALPHNSGQNWAASLVSLGTPGRPNSVYDTNAAPLLLEVAHSPPVPRSANPITITARAVDERPVGITATLFFRHASTVSPPDFSSVPMVDDGAHEDGLAGDGIYGAVLPAQTNRALIEFYVRATDASGQTRTWPTAARQLDGSFAQTCNAILQVDDSPAAGSPPLYRVIMTEAERQELDAIGRDVGGAAFSDATMNGTWITQDGVGTEVRHNAGFRNRGHGSRVQRPNNIRVEIPNDRRWRGLTALNLNSLYGYVEVAGSALFQKAGLPAPNARAVQVRVNGANLALGGPPQFGIYAALEDWGAEFIGNHFPLDPGGNCYRGLRMDAQNLHADFNYRGPDKSAYSNLYFKETNRSVDDYSDLILLCHALTNTPDAEFTTAVGALVDVDNWLLYFALNTLVDNRETSLANGWGDDYALYFGGLDGHCRLIASDADTILNEGDTRGVTSASLFRMTEANQGVVPHAIRRFIERPDFVPRYYGLLHELIQTAFSPSQLNDTLVRAIGDLVPPMTISNMVGWSAQRNAYVLSQIPSALTVTTPLPVVEGYPQTTSAQVLLDGQAPAVESRSIKLNGTSAAFDPVGATWSGTATLQPGVQRLLVQAFGSAGQEIARTNLDIWYHAGPGTVVPLLVVTNTVWSAAQGPYRVNGPARVAAEVTVAIEPGTTLYFAEGAGLTVHGQLLVQGTPEHRIRFTREPGAGALTNFWNGVCCRSSDQVHLLQCVDIEFAGGAGYSVQLEESTLIIEDCTFSGTTRTHVDIVDKASFAIRKSVFSSPAEAPVIRGSSIAIGGVGIIEENVFGPASGPHAIIDYGRTRRPGPVLQVLSNLFAGSTYDLLRLRGCDAHIEGNVFLHVRRCDTADAAFASAIAADRHVTDETNHVPRAVAVRNLLCDVDRMASLTDGAYLTAENNTIVGATVALVSFDDPARRAEGVTPGSGACLDGNIFWNPPGYHGSNFANVLVNDPTYGTTDLVLHRSILAGADFLSNGIGNVHVDPRLFNADPATISGQTIRDDFRLRPGSPARGTGPNGLDMGALVPAGASISGEPPSPTPSTSATLVVGGPGVTYYAFSLNGGPWSEPFLIATPILLSDLPQGGPNTICVIGRDSAGFWSDPGQAAVCRSWVVHTNFCRLIINEVLARNDQTLLRPGGSPDLVELFNAGGTTVALAGLGMTDDPADPFKFVFPPGISLAPGEYLVLLAAEPDGSADLCLGFGLNDQGDALYLYDATGQLLDHVVFGIQLADWSIGRLAGGDWGLTRPTFGSVNAPQPSGEVGQLKINEWLAEASNTQDFIELYSADSLPVGLGGLFLTDAPAGGQRRHQIAPLSFIDGGSHCLFIADGDARAGPSHLDFKLAPEQGFIALFAEDLSPIDCVFYGPQTSNRSEGRQPSGAASIASFEQPTPGAANPASPGLITIRQTVFNLAPLAQSWRYHQAGIDLGTVWRSADYDDSAWAGPSPAILGNEDCACLPAPGQNTVLTSPARRTTYFRTTFVTDTNLSGFSFRARLLVDDGAVIYLNGGEAARTGMNVGTVAYATLANRVVADAALEELMLPNALLVTGTNHLAVEVHQGTPVSPDVVWAMALDALRFETNYPTLAVVLNEIMASNRSITNQNGQATDWIECYNPATNATDLSGMSLSDRLDEPRRWVFPPGVVLPSGGSLVIFCDSASLPSRHAGPVLNTGFGLKAETDQVHLFAAPEHGGALLDSITFGIQTPDCSIGRLPDGGGSWQLNLPTPGTHNLAATLGEASKLRINEWMAYPDSGEDWFEIFNPNSQPVALGGLFLTDDVTPAGRTKYRVPPLSFIGVADNGFVRFWADNDSGQGADHAAFRLGREGESLGLYSAAGFEIDQVAFLAQQRDVAEGRFPDGAATAERFPEAATPGASNLRLLADVVINEVLTHSDPPLEDAIELHNLSLTSMDLGGWYLTDRASDPFLFRIPEGTVLEPRGFLVLYENQFNQGSAPLPGFALNSATGDDVALFPAASAGELTGFRARVSFGAAEKGVTWGRCSTSLGTDFSPLTARTFGVDHPGTLEEFRAGAGLSNAPAQVGPIVINEIHYHPPDAAGSGPTNDNVLDEFIELRNITAQAVPLFDPALTTNTWRLQDAVEFSFPSGVVLPAGGFLLVVSFDPVSDPAQLDAFRVKMGLVPGNAIVGPYRGRLGNDRETLELLKPDQPVPPGTAEAGLVPVILVDRVEYDDAPPWPGAADGSGSGPGISLQRRTAQEYGNDPVNWFAGVPTPGADNGQAIVSPPTIAELTPPQTVPPGSSLDLVAHVLGPGPLHFQWRLDGRLIPEATNSLLCLGPLQPPEAGVYSLLVSNPGGADARSTRVDLELPPTIASQPLNRSVAIGGRATFTVMVTAAPPLTYQWRRNGVDLAGATQPSLVISNAQASDEGSYSLAVSNRHGAVLSSPAELRVLSPPRILEQPQDLVVDAGDDAVFTVSAEGAEPLFYQWHLDGREIAGAATFTLRCSNVQFSDGGTYLVTVANSVGFTTSLGAELVVRPVFAGVRILPGGACLLTLRGVPGRSYAVECAADLKDWRLVGTVTAHATPTEFADDSPLLEGQRFYRLRLWYE